MSLKPTLRSNAISLTNTQSPKVSKKHPYTNKDNHDALLKHIESKLDTDASNRNSRICRFAKIDFDVSGWIRKYSGADEDRKKIKEETGEPAVVKQNLNLIQMHLDDMVAFYLDIFAPTRGIYYAMGDAGKNEDIKKMAKLLSQQGKHTGRIKELNRFFTNAVKYNLGGIHTYWKETYGSTVNNDSSGEVAVKDQELIWQGNSVDSLDMYNTLWDPNCDPIDVWSDGEWCAEVETRSTFYIMRKFKQEKYFNLVKAFEKTNQQDTRYKYYRSPPTEARIEALGVGNSNEQDFSKLWQDDSAKSDVGKSNEVVKFFGFLVPTAFGLGESDDYRLFEIHVLNSNRIILAKELNNAHGGLPHNYARPIDDQMGGSQKSFSEVLTPLQDFASYCLNTHSEAVKSKIYGTRIYNSTYIDVDGIPKGEVNVNIPTKPGARDVPMTNIVHKLPSDVDTNQLMDAMGQAMNLANEFFPATQMPNQVAGIDRAVNSQVAAAVQGANKRLKKYGRIIVDQCLEPSKRMQILNAQQYFKKDEFVNEGEGLESITGENLRNITVSANIGHGLMNLDRDKMVQDLKDLMFAVFQSQKASEQIDVVTMLKAIGDFMDYGIDFDTFRIQQPQQPQQPTTPTDGQGETENVPQGIPPTDGGVAAITAQ